MGLPSPFVFNAVVDIVTRFFDIDLSVLILRDLFTYLGFSISSLILITRLF